MGYETDLVKFRNSFSDELKSVKNRVRFLIGSSHWGEDGRYKEAILKNVLIKHLPENIGVGTGFIIKKDGEEIKRSKQIDIIIYNATYPILFREGDFVVTTPESVIGIIEVKTKLTSSNIKETFLKAKENSNFLIDYDLPNFKVFKGLFSFESDYNSENVQQGLEKLLREYPDEINHICLGENIFIRKFEKEEDGVIEKYFRIYEIENLSFSYFISNLIEKAPLLANNLDTKDLYWALFPLHDGKNPFRICKIAFD